VARSTANQWGQQTGQQTPSRARHQSPPGGGENSTLPEEGAVSFGAQTRSLHTSISGIEWSLACASVLSPETRESVTRARIYPLINDRAG
jgi:hypothetical protein